MKVPLMARPSTTTAASYKCWRELFKDVTSDKLEILEDIILLSADQTSPQVGEAFM